jgi:hypothetical protein
MALMMPSKNVFTDNPGERRQFAEKLKTRDFFERVRLQSRRK